jgi:hypothetical protein
LENSCVENKLTIKRIIKKNSLEAHIEMITCILMTLHQNAGQKIANRFFENVAKLKYFGTTVTNQNLIHEKIKSRLNSGDACYHSDQYDLSSRLLYKNVKCIIHKTIM